MLRISLALLLFFVPFVSHAATMSLSSSASQVAVGDIVTVRILVNPSGVAVNNAEAVLRFPPDTLEVLSVSKSGSLFSIWVEEPSFSNGAGTVAFNAGIPNPGVSTAGTAVSVTFQARRAGNASLSLSDAAVRANDGLGTDVLTGAFGTQVTVAAPVVAPAPTPTPAPVAPVAETPTLAPRAGTIAITSSTHPDAALWYADPNPLFAWELPDGATGVQLGVSESADSLPTVSYTTPLTQRRINDVEDGRWYFHMRYRSGGAWSSVSSYAFRIDTSAPVITTHDFIYDEAARELVLDVEASDAGSGIQHYEVAVDGEVLQSIPANKFDGRSVSVPLRSAGIHRITLTAVDGAGNRTAVEGTVSVPRSLDTQVLFTIGSLEVTLLAVLLGMALFSLLSLAAAVVAWHALTVYRYRKHPAVPTIRKDMHRRFLKLKSNMEVDIRSLDRARTKRELSREEILLYRRLVQNVASLEKHLDQMLKDLD